MKIMDAVDNAAKYFFLFLFFSFFLLSFFFFFLTCKYYRIMWFQSLCSLYNNYKTVVEEMGECLSRFSSFFDNLTEETEKERFFFFLPRLL